MKIKLISDLHMEGFKYQYEWHGEDVVVLAGDIHTKNRHREILDQIPQDVKIFMVAGNHEYYNNEFYEVNDYLLKLQDEYQNFTFLNNDVAYLRGGISIFGGTMFTDFGLYGESNRWWVEKDAQWRVTDFELISIRDKDDEVLRRWNIQDHKNQYKKFNENFDKWIENTKVGKRICVTHFGPSSRSISPQFTNNSLNPYFYANNEERIVKVDYWFHGHTHASFDYMLNDTRVICNPKGYGNENSKGFNDALIIEI